ncbi:MAG TPA: single-stranded DNA-binding protein [Bacillota bacterium]|nr:single-stranded DNA-binding protein [Bacillota bacterium]HPL53436.1 single-stranded DNA-binding protein [Bacillota bacterium]
MNRVALVGRLTRDPEIRYTADNQTPIAKFSIAVDRIYKRDGQPTADFIPIVVFGKSADNCGKYLGKGRLVAVSGRLQTRSWDDQDGKRHYATEVIADEVDFLDRGSDTKGQGSEGASGSDVDDFRPMEEEDDLPF